MDSSDADKDQNTCKIYVKYVTTCSVLLCRTIADDRIIRSYTRFADTSRLVCMGTLLRTLLQLESKHALNPKVYPSCPVPA